MPTRGWACGAGWLAVDDEYPVFLSALGSVVAITSSKLTLEDDDKAVGDRPLDCRVGLAPSQAEPFRVGQRVRILVVLARGPG
jgi:hypothetical protein